MFMLYMATFCLTCHCHLLHTYTCTCTCTVHGCIAPCAIEHQIWWSNTEYFLAHDVIRLCAMYSVLTLTTIIIWLPRNNLSVSTHVQYLPLLQDHDHTVCIYMYIHVQDYLAIGRHTSDTALTASWIPLQRNGLKRCHKWQHHYTSPRQLTPVRLKNGCMGT